MFKILTIHFSEETCTFEDDVLNKFLMNKTLKSCKKEFFISGGRPYWTVFLEYEPVLKKEECKSNNDFVKPEEKLLFEKLRQWRKEKADSEGVPVYILATNRELGDIIMNRPKTFEALKTIKGFGAKKVEKYGKEIVDIINSFFKTE